MTLIPSDVLSLPVLLYLVNVAIASVLACGGGLILERLCRRRSLPFRHALLVTALAAALVAPLVIGAALASGRSLFCISIAALEKPAVSLRLAATHPQDQLPAAGDQAQVTAVPPAKTTDAREAAEAISSDRGLPADQSAAAERNQGRPSWWSERWSLLGLGLAIVWFVGSAVSSWRLVQGLSQVRRLSRGLQPITDSRLEGLAAATARQLGLRKPVALCESHQAPAPLSLGLIRPMIVLPVGLASALAPEQLEGLLRHEMAHIVRRDHHVGLLQRLATIVFWWNVLAHRASARVSAICEQICDDISTGAGNADAYAAMLVDLAERVATRRTLPAALGIFDGTASEFGGRIHRLLDPKRQIRTRLGGGGKLVAAGCFLLLLLPAVMPLSTSTRAAEVEPSRPAADDQPPRAAQVSEPPSRPQIEPAKEAETEADKDGPAQAPPITWPQVLQGLIKDADGKPIAGARVRLDFEKVHEYPIGRWDELLDSQTGVTSDSGQFQFDASKFPRLTHRPFVLTLTATAQGYADAKWWSWYTPGDTSVGEHLTDLTMPESRVVRGRCVDPAGVAVPGAIVKMVHQYDSKSPASSWAWDPRETDANGRFEFNIPRDAQGAFELEIVHRQWALRRATLPPGGDDLGDLRLEPGAAVEGTVRKADGTPAAGAVVVAGSVDSGQLPGLAFLITVATRTDADGKYKLQPLAGAYRIHLAYAEKTDNSLQPAFLVADEPPPLVVPARLELSGTAPRQQDFVGRPGLKVRGTVRWPDGRPVERCEVKVSYLPPKNGLGIWIGHTLTNDQGGYTIELPNPIEHVSISVYGARDEQHVWHSAFPDEKVVAKAKYEQNIACNRLTGDLDNMDWVLRPREQ